MIIILPISINLILCILLFIVYCVHVLYVRFDMCKINDSQSVSQSGNTFVVCADDVIVCDDEVTDDIDVAVV